MVIFWSSVNCIVSFSTIQGCFGVQLIVQYIFEFSSLYSNFFKFCYCTVTNLQYSKS